ncbi:MAG: (2E,6E)-farnesyl diphosphate synthase [Idiomarina sp.]|nr:(2E,6E)-farnesyl diphosphate synthase [Idiomarina sp.]MCL5049525.1 (2E,6E)-farnesyl diphosphate synthase [Bacillota bacterium]
MRNRHSDFLTQYLNQREAVSPQLLEAMKYAVLLGGKRVRPFLVYAVGSMLGATLKDLDAPAAAIECIHAYSLVHDDLPAMDNDTLRRGQPTCHIAFDEATAILAGDALQALAFELLCTHPYEQVNSAAQLRLVQELARSAGDLGMCGGQALDLAATGSQVGQTQLEQIHAYKTGALIRCAVTFGLTCAPDVSAETAQALRKWADIIGLAFQVQDDILDVVGDTQALGKSQGTDQQQGKSTYPGLMGLNQAQAYLQQLHEKALHALQGIPYNTQLLQQFTDYLITRDR